MAKTSREKDLQTLEAMGAIYCRGNHGACTHDVAGLCAACRETVEATLERTENCPNGHKGNCEDCPIKCNRGEQRENIRAIMRYAAPRMLLRHPVMTAHYAYKKLRKQH